MKNRRHTYRQACSLFRGISVLFWILGTSFTGCHEFCGFPLQSGQSRIIYMQNATGEAISSAGIETDGSLIVEKLIHENAVLERCSDDTYLVAGLLGLLLFVSTICLLYHVQRMKNEGKRVTDVLERAGNGILDSFSRNCSTPLLLIRELSRQLRDNQVNREIAMIYLDNIVRQSESLLRLVSVQSDANVQPVSDQTLWKKGDVATYVSVLIGRFQLYARQKEIELRCVSYGTDFLMDFVPDYFCRMMENLLFYGIRYADRGGKICFTIKREANILVLKMIVSGKVVRTGTPLSDPYNTQSGIGSFFMETDVVVKQVGRLVEYMGGKVRTEEFGQNITVCVTLPLKHGDSCWELWTLELSESGWLPFEGLRKESVCSAEKDSCVRPSILLVTIDGIFPSYIGDLLSNGFYLLCASDRLEALEKAEGFMPDLVVFDGGTGKNNGKEIYDEMRSLDTFARIPVVAVTADKAKKGYYWISADGMDTRLSEPFDTSRLLAFVTAMLERRQQEVFDYTMDENAACSIDLSPTDRNFMERLHAVISAQISDSSLNLVQVAEKMGMSKSQINRRIRAITGNSTVGYILRLRMEQAELLLTSTDLSIGDVAVRCGFDDAGYFARVFKQSFHTTPSSYRKKIHR